MNVMVKDYCIIIIHVHVDVVTLPLSVNDNFV